MNAFPPILLPLFLAFIAAIPLFCGGNQFFKLSPLGGQTWMACVLIFLLLGWWLSKIKRWRWFPWPGKIRLWAFLYISFSLVSVFTSISPEHSLREFQTLIMGLVLGFLVVELCTSKKHIQGVAWSMVIGAGLVSAYGIEQALFGLPQWLQEAQAENLPKSLEYIVADGRIFSTFINVNAFAAFLVMVLPIGIFFLLKETDWKIQIWAGGLLLLILSALALTGSKGGLALGLMVFALTAAVSMRHCEGRILARRLGPLVLTGFLLVGSYWSIQPVGINNPMERFFSLSQGIKVSSEGRMSYWKGAVKIVEENPWIGTGLGTFGLSYQQVQEDGFYSRFAHNLYLQKASEIGLMGLLLFFLLVGSVLRLKRGEEGDKGLKDFLFIGMMALLIHGLFDFSWESSANQWGFYVLGGMMVALWRIEKDPVVDTIPMSLNRKWLYYGISVPLTILLVIGVIRPFFGEGYYKAAVAASIANELDKAIDLSEESLYFGVHSARTMNFLGTAYRGKWEKTGEKSWLIQAKEVGERAVLSAPRVGLYHNELGKTLWKMGDYKGAVREWELAHTYFPLNPRFAMNLGRGLWATDQVSEATQILNQALEMEEAFLLAGNYNLLPFFKIHFLLAEIYNEKGEVDKALNEYQRLVDFSYRVPEKISMGPLLAGRLTISPKFWYAPRGYLEMGDLYHRKGLQEEALVSYKNALKLNANYQKAIHRIKSLEGANKGVAG